MYIVSLLKQNEMKLLCVFFFFNNHLNFLQFYIRMNIDAFYS